MKSGFFIDQWCRFFFSRRSVIQLAILRIALGLLIIQFVCLLAPDRSVWFGANSCVDPRCVAENFGYPVFNIRDLIPDQFYSIEQVFLLLVVSGICLIVGYRTKCAAAVAFFCLLSIYHSNPFILNSGDTYMRQLLFWMIFSHSGEALSLVDKFRASKITKSCAVASTWPLRMMQFQFCMVYADSFIHKVQNESWLNGSAVYYTLKLTEFQKLPIPGLSEHIEICRVLTWLTLILEYSLCTLIWYKPVRYALLASAAVFHFLIDLQMNIPQFEWLMIASLALFIDTKDIFKIWQIAGRVFVQREKREIT